MVADKRTHNSQKPMSCPHTLVYVPPDGQRAVVVKLAGEKCNKLV